MTQVIEVWQPSTNINIDYSSYQVSVNEGANYIWTGTHNFTSTNAIVVSGFIGPDIFTENGLALWFNTSGTFGDEGSLSVAKAGGNNITSDTIALTGWLSLTNGGVLADILAANGNGVHIPYYNSSTGAFIGEAFSTNPFTAEIKTANNILDDGSGRLLVSGSGLTSAQIGLFPYSAGRVLGNSIGFMSFWGGNDNVGGFIGENYNSIQIGMYNRASFTSGAIAGNSWMMSLGINYNGAVYTFDNTNYAIGVNSPVNSGTRNILDDGAGGFSFASGGSINGGLVIENGNTIRITNSNNSSKGIQYFQSASNTVWAQIGFREMAVTDVLDIYDGNFKNYALAIAGNSTSYSLNTTEITSVGTLHSGSDIRLKPDFTEYDSDVLAELKNVQFGQYSQWHNPKSDNLISTGKMKASINAQTLPDKVKAISEDGYAGIRFPDVDAWLIGIAQELLKRIEKLEKIIETGEKTK